MRAMEEIYNRFKKVLLQNIAVDQTHSDPTNTECGAFRTNEFRGLIHNKARGRRIAGVEIRRRDGTASGLLVERNREADLGPHGSDHDALVEPARFVAVRRRHANLQGPQATGAGQLGLEVHMGPARRLPSRRL